MKRLQELQDATAAWSDSVFGAGRKSTSCLHHLKLEVDELIESPADAFEYADALLLLLDAWRMAGGNAAVLLETAFAKLEINKARQWGEADHNGVVRHIKEAEA